MSDVTIPEDVMKAAKALSLKYGDELWTSELSIEIAHAILAERQRCERICVERAQQHRTAQHAYDDEASQNSCLSDAIEALSCAHAIRSPHE